MADVVVAEVRRRHAERAPPRTAVERRRDLELLALLPHRVVVVGAVEADHVVPDAEVGSVRPVLGNLGDRPVDHAIEHDGLQPEFSHRMFQLGDGLVRVVHGNHRRGRHTILQRLEKLGLIHVERTAGREPRLGVVDAGQAEAHGREQNGEVDAEFVKALVEEPRHHRRRAVARILGRCAPKRFLRNVFAAPLDRCHVQRTAHPVAVDLHGPCGGIAADLAHRVRHHGTVFQPMAIGVDHRMAEFSAQFCTFACHVSPSLTSRDACECRHLRLRGQVADSGCGR